MKVAPVFFAATVGVCLTAVGMHIATLGDIGLRNSNELVFFARRWVDFVSLVAIASIVLWIAMLARNKLYKAAAAVFLVGLCAVTFLAMAAGSYRAEATNRAVDAFHKQRLVLADEAIRIGSGGKIDGGVRNNIRDEKTKFELDAAMPNFSRYDYVFVDSSTGKRLIAAATFENAQLRVTVFDSSLPEP
jgi:signal transduction histidine kinase